MSETYYVAGVDQPTGTDPAVLLHAVCAAAGIKPARLDEVHLYSDSASALFKRRLDTPQGTIIQWPNIPFLPVSGLFSACRALESGEISTCVVAEQTAQVNRVVLLAGPAAIGRMNLAPLAHLSVRFTYPGGIPDISTATTRALAAIPSKEIEPENGGEPAPQPALPTKPWLAVHSSEKPRAVNWPVDRLIHGLTMLSSLDLLIKALVSTKTEPGVWISVNQADPAAVMLVLPL